MVDQSEYNFWHSRFKFYIWEISEALEEYSERRYLKDLVPWCDLQGMEEVSYSPDDLTNFIIKKELNH